MNSLHQAVGCLSMRKEPLPFDAAEIVHELWYQASIPSIEVPRSIPPPPRRFSYIIYNGEFC